jgi:hypothetical protein
MAQSFVKDPEAVLDYQINWAAQMTQDSDTISTSVWDAEAGITIDSESETTTAATVWLSGGTAGNSYTVTNTITTAGSRTDERSIEVVVEEK